MSFPNLHRSVRPTPALFLLASLLGFAGWSVTAHASDACDSDSDCATDEMCVITESCPGPEEDEPAECRMMGQCMPMRDTSPMPWPDEPEDACDSDSDCEDGWRCDEVDGYNECLPPWASECESDSDCESGFLCFDDVGDQGLCGPQWLGACEEDDDCGSGFVCEELERCTCSGDPGVPPRPGDGEGWDDGDDADEDTAGASTTEPAREPGDAPDAEPFGPKDREDGCVCESAGESYCELVREECDSDSDCADGWVCERDPDGVVTNCPDDLPDDPSSGADPMLPETCADEDESRICVPREMLDYRALSGALGGRGGGDPAFGPETGEPGENHDRDDTAMPDGEGDDAAFDGGEAYERDGGCSSATAGGSAGGLLLLLGLLFGLRQRRGVVSGSSR